MPIRFSQLKLPLLVFLSAIILAVAGMLLLGQMNQSPEPQATPNPAPTPQPIAVPEVPDDWQTYRNEEFGFEVRHPNDLMLIQEDASTFVSFGKREQAVIGERSMNIKVLRAISGKEALIEKSVGTHTIITCCAVLPKYSTKAHDCMNFKQLLYKGGAYLDKR
jgi:hypothetical protein